MKKLLPLLGAVIALGFSSCAQQQSVRTNYVAPSTGAVKTSVSGAQSSLTAAKTRSMATNAAIAAAAARAKSVTDRLKVLASSTSGAAHSLVLQVQTDVDLLTKSLLDAKTQNDALSQNVTDAQQSLIAAQAGAAQLQTAVNSQTTELNHTAMLLNNEIAVGAKNKAIVTEVDRFWGLGAFAYGFKRLAVHLLILAAVGIVIFIIAMILFPDVILPALRIVGEFIGAILGRISALGRSRVSTAPYYGRAPILRHADDPLPPHTQTVSDADFPPPVVPTPTVETPPSPTSSPKVSQIGPTGGPQGETGPTGGLQGQTGPSGTIV